MATTTVSAPATLNRLLLRPLGAVGTAALLALTGLAITTQFPTATPLEILVVATVFGVAAWMLLNGRYGWSLAILMLYIGLADGYIKLSTDSPQVTLLRDLLLYAIVVGVLLRGVIRKQTLSFPPLAGWVLAWVIVVGVQIANPANGTLFHSVASVRPHAEWVPLFFFAYMLMRSKDRLRNFLLLLAVVAAINGIVGLIQLNLTPEEFSSWGPGYEKAINGEGSVSGRTFTDSSGTARTRPFGLGPDIGFAGFVGMMAVPAALALLALARRPGTRTLIVLLSAGVVIAVATSQARTAVIGSLIAVFAYAALTVTSRAGLRTVLAIGLVGIVAYGTIGLLSSNSDKGSFRYESISGPGEAVSTAYEYRRDTLARIPTYAAEFPLGDGIGSHGPAASLAGGSGRKHDAESEPTFLLVELGIPGLLVMLGFQLTLFYLSITRIRKIADHEARILLTAIAAPLFAVFSTWFVGVSTANVPGAPYLWFAAGILAYWLIEIPRHSNSATGGGLQPQAA